MIKHAYSEEHSTPYCSCKFKVENEAHQNSQEETIS